MHCPDGWELFADTCYLVGEGEMSWSDAKAWCHHNNSRYFRNSKWVPFAS